MFSGYVGQEELRLKHPLLPITYCYSKISKALEHTLLIVR